MGSNPIRFFATTVFLFAGLLPGQDYRGSIVGRVTDSTGAVVPGVSIVAVNEATNVASATRSNAEGNYLVALLDPGLYTITVETPGFKKLLRSGVAVRTSDKLTLDFQLEVGATSDSVTVTGEVPLLQTNSADIAQVIERRFLDLLYVPSRNPLTLVSLTAGVLTGVGGVNTGADFSGSQQAGFGINGGAMPTGNGNNEVTVDGASVVMPRQGGSIATSPSGDTVEELRVQTTMFDAAYGHSNGGVVTYATRSGTNQLHGSFEDFYRNKAFNANTWRNNKLGLPRGEDSRQFWSGAVGGPVWIPKLYNGRSRTFFFTTLERQSYSNPNTTSARVPTDAERQGDFSQTLNSQGGPLTIYNPWSTVVSGTTTTRQPFSGNKVPGSLLNTTGVAIMNQYPKANLNVPAQLGLYNWARPGRTDNSAWQLSQRIDQVISDKQRMFGRFSIIDVVGKTPTAVPGLYSAPLGGGAQGQAARFYTASLNDDYLFSPTLILSMRYSLARYWNDVRYSGNTLDPKLLKLPDAILGNQMHPGWPTIITGEGMYQIGARYKWRVNDSHVLVPTFTKLAGAHNLRFGVETRLINWIENSPDTHAAGYFTFNAGFTQADPQQPNSAKTSGTSMASLLLGIPASGDISGPTPYALRSYFLAGFVQDDWKITRHLTLNFGVRYELETPWTERYDHLFYGFDYTSPNPVKVPGMNLRGGPLFAGINGASRRTGDVDWNNFGPRFGFAWQARPGTVLRGGYGLFYASAIGNLDTVNSVPSTFNTDITYIASQDRGFTPYTTLADPFPNGIPRPPGNSLGTASLLGQSFSFLAQDHVLPYAQQWQFSIQHSLPLQIRVEAAFVRELSVKGLQSFGLNEKPDAYLALGSQENLQVANPFYGTFPVETGMGSSKTIAQRQLWLAYPQYTGITQNATNSRTTVYHAVQLMLEKRLTHGLSVLANATVSKLMDNNLTSLVNTRHYRTISSHDTPRVYNVAFVYDLPFGPGRPFLTRRGPLSKIIGGWSFSGSYHYESGNPLSISDSNGRPLRIRNAAKSGPIVDRIGDRIDPVTRKVLNPYFDITAFQSLPTQYMVSPEPPSFGELRGPPTRVTGASLIKRFKMHERVSVDARLDAAGATNTPNWGNPGANMANASTFGIITNASGSRTMQLAFRAVF